MRKQMDYLMKSLLTVFILSSIFLVLGKSFAQETTSEKLGIDGGYFTCSIPADWERQDDELEEGDKTYQLLLLGPRAENAPVMIFLSYFGEGNDDFTDYQDFVQRNTWDSWEDKAVAEAKKITVNGNNGLWFEREEKSFLHPESKSDESVMIKNKYYVFLDKKRKGFFVLHYTSPSSAFNEHLNTFEKIANSFRLI